MKTFSYYVHIPYCVRRCGYCDFNTYTPSELQDGATLEIVSADYIDAVLRELDTTPTDEVSTIFFGGGTPSLIPPKDLGRVLTAIRGRNGITADCEITLEANPDDISKEKLSSFKSMGINRLSMGVQSFVDEDLIWMNRAHRSEAAIEAMNTHNAWQVDSEAHRILEAVGLKDPNIKVGAALEGRPGE